ncbi:sugar ABC transporter permease [Bacillus sp. FJAT-50079]|uniref:carbohydrate ABC transporter permease n=1 Tax=Bacillus sp. FJAT-50079 TaxID=2833577 RepID=UPI001BC98A23|nr:sugar ABC transporter permease [Bacillus sp. FJAT-50079]MBS4206586.1 sugar ABC transporter permease [Bacillus sp. FJAT-50079]
MYKHLSNKTAISIFLLPAILIYVATVFIPLIWSLGYSFFNWNGLTPMKFNGLANYQKLFFHDSTFWKTIWNTGKFTILNTFIQVFFGLFMAILLTAIRRGREFFQTIYFTPVIISSVAIVEIFNNIYSVEPLGLLNSLLGMINSEFHNIEWLTNPNLSLLSGTIAEGFRYAGVYMVIFYAALVAIPEEIIEAAKIDGASGWSLFRKIKLPLIKPVFITCVVLVLNGSLKAFDVPYLLTQGGPGTSSELTITYMYKEAFSSLSYGYGSAIAVFIAVMSFLVVILVMTLSTNRGEKL